MSYSNFAQELALKQLVAKGQAEIIYIHGTARSGSTIAEIILTQLVDLTIHQPFRGKLQKSGGHNRSNKLKFDLDIYEAGCGFIVQKINQFLLKFNSNKVTVVIKELAGFFQPNIWQRWVKIPEKFIFTIREPHLQYFSWLSAMTDKLGYGQGKLQENRNLVIERAAITEESPLPAEWQGTTISCNRFAWSSLKQDFSLVNNTVTNNQQKVAVIDSILLRYKPKLVLQNTLLELGFSLNSLNKINLNNLTSVSTKIWDIRDKSRPMVRKANKSNIILPLQLGEAISLDIFPPRSQQHIQELIPWYLELLFSPKLIYRPTITELETKEDRLIASHPFMAYAIALFNLQDRSQTRTWITKQAAIKSIPIDQYQTSFAIIDQYYQQALTIHG